MKITTPLRNDPTLWKAPTWYQALSLTERSDQRSADHRLQMSKQVPSEEAIERLHAWKMQPPFDHGTFFAERLASDSLAEEDLLAFLAESAEDVQRFSQSPPEWLDELTEAFSQVSDDYHTLPISQEIAESHLFGPYLPTISPLLSYGFTALQKGMHDLQKRHTAQPFDTQKICQSFLNHLIPQLLLQISKTMVLEMHVARLQGRLHGETPEERFADFIHHLCQKEQMLSVFAEYPVLVRSLLTTIKLWADYALEILDHLCADWSAICTTLTPDHAPGLLLEVLGGVGDRHRRGRSVQILSFSSGLRLLYKPKPLAVDSHFQELLIWLNEHGAQPAFRILKLLDRGTYGWSEYVSATSCSSREEVVRFYERQGEYLALFYALNATDCHSENVIAAGEHPMLIDLESLFHPRTENEDPAQSEDIAFDFMYQSVLRVGLLPQWLWSSEDSPGVDISGLGGCPGQIMPHLLPGWSEVGTDQMHLTLQQAEMPAGQNRPQINDQAVHAPDYRSNIVSGFTSMYRLLMTLRDELLADQLPRFAQDEIRILLRPTRFYALLLMTSFHPDLLRDALERDRFFDRLWQGVEQWPDLARFIPAERRDLLRGDIPLFTTSSDGRTVYSSEGEALGNLFQTSGLELARQQIQRLDERDLTRQIWIIEASLATLQMGEASSITTVQPFQPARQPVSRAQLLAQAKAIGTRLEELAFQNAEGASWLGLNLIREKVWSLAPTDSNLYDGASGISLFLAYLGAITAEERFTSLARLALAPIRRQISLLCAQSPDQQKDLLNGAIGAFEGPGSLIYLLTHLSVLWNEPTLAQEAEELIPYLPVLIDQDERLDIVSGSAGCILSLLSFNALYPSEHALAKAMRCGDHLLATAQAMPTGAGWITGKDSPPLGGFSHGSAGIALSLLQLATISGEERFWQTAQAALAYDRSLFLPERQNWADLRVFPTPASETEQPGERTAQRCMVAWCHGAAGIGLGRLGLVKLMDDELLREEIDTALHIIMTEGLAGNHSLCHGALGNADVLLTATHLLHRSEDQARLESALALIAGSLEANGWVTGVPLGIETPGLMTGLAGIGYELLRLAEPDRLPSVLLVEPPMR